MLCLSLSLGNKVLSHAGPFFTTYEAFPHTWFHLLHEEHVSGVDALTVGLCPNWLRSAGLCRSWGGSSMVVKPTVLAVAQTRCKS